MSVSLARELCAEVACREVVEARIATYPPGALEFSLLALHDDPLPSLQSQLNEAHTAGNETLAINLMDRISDESSKRERWAVSGLFTGSPAAILTRSSSKILYDDTTTLDSFTLF